MFHFWSGYLARRESGGAFFREVSRADSLTGAPVCRGARPTLGSAARTAFHVFSLLLLHTYSGSQARDPDRRRRRCPGRDGRMLEMKTLSGGSLGSRVDEERSQLRELM